MVMQKSKSFIPTVAKKFRLNKYVVIPKLFLHCNLFCKLTVECGNIAKFNAEISAKSGIWKYWNIKSWKREIMLFTTQGQQGRGRRRRTGPCTSCAAHAISLWPDDLVQLLHCSVGHHFLEKRKGEKGIYWIFQNLIGPRPQLPALHLWDSAPDLRGLEYQMLLWPMLEAAVALVHTLKSKFSVKVALASTLMGTQERGSYIKVDK